MPARTPPVGHAKEGCDLAGSPALAAGALLAETAASPERTRSMSYLELLVVAKQAPEAPMSRAAAPAALDLPRVLGGAMAVKHKLLQCSANSRARV